MGIKKTKMAYCNNDDSEALQENREGANKTKISLLRNHSVQSGRKSYCFYRNPLEIPLFSGKSRMYFLKSEMALQIKLTPATLLFLPIIPVTLLLMQNVSQDSNKLTVRVI